MLRGTRLSHSIVPVLFLFVAAGCGQYPTSAVHTDASSITAQNVDRTDSNHGRAIIESAKQSVETFDVSGASQRVTAIVVEHGGYIASSDVDPEQRARYELRVPAQHFYRVLDQFAQLGTEVSRDIKTKEVTAELIDLRARLASRVALRERIRSLLDEAASLETILRLEKELARVQHQIEELQAQLRFLENSVALADIELDLGRPQVLGPLAWTAKALGSGVKKAFVWKD